MRHVRYRRAGFIFVPMMCCLLAVCFIPTSILGQTAPGRTMAKQATKGKQLWITADHSKHEILKQDFKTGPEVTKACLSCHSEAAMQFQKTILWTWRDPHTEESAQLGKGGLSVNNF